MMRIIFCGLCMISVLVTSCNDHVDETVQTEPGKEKQLRDLVAQFPDSVLLKENLVQYFRESGNYEQAIKETENELKKDSLNARFQGIKATLYFENGDTIHAIKTYEKAVSIHPQPGDVISLASLYALTKNPLALEMANAILQAQVPDARKKALFIKGTYYSYTGDKIKAIHFFDTCISLDYRDVLAYKEKAICLYSLNKFTEALEVLKKAVAVQKTFDEAYYWMGRCYEKTGKTKEAIENYQLALQLDPGYDEAKEALGKLGVNN